MNDFDGHFEEDNSSQRDQREAERMFELVIDAAELLGPLYVLTCDLARRATNLSTPLWTAS
jgi:hypothetical protein